MADKIQKIEIDQEKKRLYIYKVKDNSMLMSNPPPPPSYYREIYSFDDLTFIEKEFAEVTRAVEEVKFSSTK